MKIVFVFRLKELRQTKSLTQLDVSSALKISDRLYAYYESINNLRMPSCHTLIKLANYFEVSIDFLLGRSDNPKINK